MASLITKKLHTNKIWSNFVVVSCCNNQACLHACLPDFTSFFATSMEAFHKHTEGATTPPQSCCDCVGVGCCICPFYFITFFFLSSVGVLWLFFCLFWTLSTNSTNLDWPQGQMAVVLVRLATAVNGMPVNKKQ